MSQTRGITDLNTAISYMEFEAELRRRMLAAFNMPAHLLGGDTNYAAARSQAPGPYADRGEFDETEPDVIAPSFDFQPAVIRQSPAVRMANRSLPNPKPENEPHGRGN